ncbi:ABC transporter ATP-binding protein [Methylobacterium isbiliense]|uniref:Bicarbonate transport ATP-binding protein CmpD n=1 Tax=Methylobacterium isbiliense TaxID=315478 RepID=A0ABQ4SGG7_9HYPH|nr:ABC transporter ATP-binding protein [Methylobacterium isbiliense]MDN3626029.1 ABC transporter ATP-binding protein [Methylobacterium isbiliense]GJE02322.1 Bicarbonate transport ATP-binding protein CmpD [Methylobacterium isbiliense]
MAGLIEIRALALAFTREGARTEVLADLDLDVEPGEFLAIVGASGVGKSTLLRVIADLVRPSAGSVRLSPPAPGRRAVALVFQDARLLPWRRILDNVAFGLEKLRLARAERRRRAGEALARVGLAALAARWPFQLSGGQRQRVALARALAVEPHVLLMDEPFSALDALTRESLQDELSRLCGAARQTVLFVTHDIEEAVYLADRIVVLAGSPGRIVATHTVPAPRPRDRAAPALQETARRIRRDLTAPDRLPA